MLSEFHEISAVIQLAKYLYTAASLKHTEELKSIGATHVFDRNITSSALISEVAKATAGSEPLKHAYDSVSLKETQELAAAVLPAGGSIALVLPKQADFKEGTEIAQIFGGYTPDTAGLLTTLYRDHFYDLLAQGVVKVSSGSIYLFLPLIPAQT